MSEENILHMLLSMGFEEEDCQLVLKRGVTDIQEAIQHLLVSQESGSADAKEGGGTSSESKEDSINQRNEEIRTSYNEQLRKRRLEERMAKDKILKEIEHDKMTRQIDAKKWKDDTHEKDDTLMSTSPSTSSLTLDREARTESRIQVRLPDGTSIHLSLDKDASLQTLVDMAVQSVNDPSLPFSIIQPFPKRQFEQSDWSKTLEELHLFPSARLVLFLPKPEEPVNIDEEVTAALQEDTTLEEEELEGLGPSGCGESRLLHGNIQNEIHDGDEDAIRKLYGDNLTGDGSSLSRNIGTLQALSAHCIAQQITLADSKIINSISVLTGKAACQVIDVLKSWKMLSAKWMSIFLPCKIKELNLDSYGLATNELLEKLRFHTSVTLLSLKSCALLNDHGVAACLKGMQNLKLLNLGDCCRLTGHMLEYIADLKHLEILILDKLKITNECLRKFFETKKSSNLKKLSLDHCPISSDAFLDVKDCASLVSLSLSNTKISKLDFLQHFPNVSKLKLQNTSITDDELTHVRKLEKLSTLKFGGTEISDVGLAHLHGLQLISIDTANRQQVRDETITIIKDFPLRNLDLSDHIYLTDACIPSIANITSLANLSLANTKVTDGLLSLLKDLHNLEMIDLSKTLSTNHVMTLLKNLPLLHTVNLAWTNIDDEIIQDMNDCLQIFKLNLSHNNITDQGVNKLKLDNLSILILDCTLVTWNGAHTCYTNCPKLTVLRNSANKVLIMTQR